MGVPRPLEEIIIATPKDVVPSNGDMEVIGCCNPGATLFEKDGKNYVYLLLRIIEKPKTKFEGHIASPQGFTDEYGNYKIKSDWERIDKDAKITGPYSIQMIEEERRSRLTTISHLRLAKSEDGKKFEISEKPTFFPQIEYEEYGIEDARITKLEEPVKIEDEFYNYLITYVAISKEGDICTQIAATNNFEDFIRIPKEKEVTIFPRIIIFPALSKDIVIFPKKIMNPRTKRKEYLALTRPVGSGISVPSIYTAFSYDLIQWGDSRPFIKGNEKGHVGAGPPPIELENGWLLIDHQHRHLIDGTKEYVGRAYLLDKENPLKVLKKSDEIIKPHLDIETNPVVKNVTFPSGSVLIDDKLYLYCGEEDAVTAVHIYKLEEIMNYLEPI